MASLAEIRARIAEQENKNKKGNSAQSDNAIYPFWNIDEGTTATIRFLPDGNPKNEYFWVERAMIKLPFNGIKGETSVRQLTVQVPCMEMYGENCPVLAEVRPWYKDESLKEMANKYWKKRTYLFQGFVRANPLGDDKAPANPIRRFVISPQIIPLIRQGIMDPEVLELPTHYERGLDFHVRKTLNKFGKADYTTSSWARRESALTEAERSAIEAHGLFNLTDFLPKKPSEAELRVIKEMFEASVDGRPYDADKWGAYYRPYGVAAPSGSNATTASDDDGDDQVVNAPAAKPVVQEEQAAASPVVVPKATSSDKAADILAMIKARQQKSV